VSVYFFYDAAEPVPFRYLTPTRQIGPLQPPYKTNMTARDYLEFAIEDLASDTPRGLVNALGNAKRAFHLAIDGLLHQYGLFVHFRRTNFPEKVRLIDAIGMIPTGIMANLNVERNLLEHEYAVPDKTRTKEAVDVTQLLLMAIETLVGATPHEVVVGWINPRKHVLLQLEPQAGEIRMFAITARGSYKKMNGVSCVTRCRSLTGDGFSPGVRVPKRPWKTIRLDRAHHAEWQPIIKELVNVQRRHSSRRSFIDHEHLTMGVTVTLPMSLPDGVSWHEVLDRALKSKEPLATPHDAPGDAKTLTEGAAGPDTDGPKRGPASGPTR
jgi:hypothetical protein